MQLKRCYKLKITLLVNELNIYKTEITKTTMLNNTHNLKPKNAALKRRSVLRHGLYAFTRIVFYQDKLS